jgi:ubiquitin-like-conjugating enzyme ATG10
MADSRHEYKQWPFLNEEEFDLACAYFDRRYVRAKLGPNRQVFKIRHRRALTTNTTYLEILRLLELPQDDDDLSDIFAKLGKGLISERDAEMEDAEEEDHVCIIGSWM